MTIGTVGTNFITGTLVEAARLTKKAEIRSCYSRSPESAAAFAEKYHIPVALTDREAFLNDGELDFVYVASPNSLHYEWARDALLAGRNVICEKPFVSAAWELRELMALARKKGLFLFEGITTPHLPHFRLIQEKLPLVGRIRFVQLNFSQYSSRYDAFLEGKLPNLFNPAFSGGALMDLNCYNLAFVYHLFGKPEEIRYFANRAANGIDTSGMLVLRYKDFIASALAAKDSDSRSFIQIQGEKGYIASDASAGGLRSGFSLVTKKGAEQFCTQENENVLSYELLDFIETWESGDPSRCDPALEDSLARAELLDRSRADAGIVFRADTGPESAMITIV